MKGLEGKTAIITGGSRGIGKACCLAFAKEKVNIAFTYHKSEEEAQKLKIEIENLGVNCLAYKLDIRNYNECRNFVDEVLKKFNRLDILVNNAGIIKDKALMMMLLEDWHEVVDTNLGGVFNMTRACITTFLKQKNGCIINMSSVSGIVGLSRQTNYSASKAGIIGFSKALAKEVAGYNIRVNVIAPGFISTDMLSSLKDEVKKEIIEKIPLKRLGEPF
ncbi:MAG: 3-oxoacyl-ACP reductase family protein, partial [Candidatus Aenigmatarchaeota archaeon]